MSDNVTEIYTQDDKVELVFVELTHFFEANREKYGLNDHESTAVAGYFARWVQDYGYYSINDLWEEDEEGF